MKKVSFKFIPIKWDQKKFQGVIVAVANDFVPWIEVLLVEIFRRTFDANLVSWLWWSFANKYTWKNKECREPDTDLLTKNTALHLHKINKF